MANKANLCKWVNALESGKFRQAIGELKIDEKFCALGVACRVYERETKDKLDYEAWEMRNNVLPIKVKKWYGLSSTNPVITMKINGVKVRKSIINLNDKLGIKFKQFAKAIKTNFKLTCE